MAESNYADILGFGKAGVAPSNNPAIPQQTGLPTPEQRVFDNDERERQQNSEGWEAAIRQAARARQIRDAQNNSILPDSNIVRDVAGGMLKGFSSVGEFAGYATNEIAPNKFSQALERVGKKGQAAGQEIQNANDLDLQNQVEASRITGNLFTGENLSRGEAPSLRGLFHQVLPAIAEMAPQLASLIVGGAPGAALSVATGIAQAGTSQGNEQWEAIMQKSEAEMMKFSTSYNQLREQNPNMTHAEAKREIADTGKIYATVVGGTIGGVGGAATRWLWQGAPLVLGTLGKKTGETALRAAAKTAKQSITSIPARLVSGGVEEGLEETFESVGAKKAVNVAIGAEQELGEGSAGNFVMGALVGGPVNVTGAVTNDASERTAETTANRIRETNEARDNTAEITAQLEDGRIADVMKNIGQYDPKAVVAALSDRATKAGATPTEKTEANKALAQLDQSIQESLEAEKAIADKGTKKEPYAGIDAYYDPKIAEKKAAIVNFDKDIAEATSKDATAEQKKDLPIMRKTKASYNAEIVRLENAKEAALEISTEERKARIESLETTAEEITKLDHRIQQSIRDTTPDNTQELVTKATNEKTPAPERVTLTDEVIDRAISTPDKVTNEQLEMMFSSSATTEAQKNDIKIALDVRYQIEPDAPFVEDLKRIKGNLSPADKKLGFADIDSYYTRIERALTADKPERAEITLDALRRFSHYKRGKATASAEAYQKAQTGNGKQYSITPTTVDGKTTWEVKEFSWAPGMLKEATDLLTGTKSLAFHRNSKDLAANITAEADFIDAHGKLMARQIARAKTSGTAQATAIPVKKVLPVDPNELLETDDDSTAQALTAKSPATTTSSKPKVTLKSAPVNSSYIDRSTLSPAELKILDSRGGIRAVLDARKAGTLTNEGVPDGDLISTAPTQTPKRQINSLVIDRSTLTPEEVKILNSPAGIRGVIEYQDATKSEPVAPLKTPAAPVAPVATEVPAVKEVPFVAPKIPGVAENPQAASQIQEAYKELGAIQQKAIASGEPGDKDAALIPQQMIEALAKKLYPGEEMAPIRELIGILNQPEGAPYKQVAQWAWKNASGEVRALLETMSKTKSFAESPNVTFFDAEEKIDAGFSTYKTARYSPGNTLISLAPALISGESSNQVKNRTAVDIAHEILHPITQKMLETDQVFFDEVVAAREMARSWYRSAENVDQIQAMKKGEPGKNNGLNFATFEYAIAENKWNGKQDYPHEFLATAMSSDTAMAVMSQIPDVDVPNKSVLQSLKDAVLAAIKRFFGNAEIDDTLLERVIGLGYQAIAADSPNGVNLENGNIDTSTGTTSVDTSTDTGSTATDDSGDSDSDTTTPVPIEEDVQTDEAGTVDQSVEMLEREVVENAIRSGKETMYGFETDGTLGRGHEGPVTKSLASVGNMLAAHLPSGHRTVMSYSPYFISDVFLNPAYKLDDLAIYLTEPKKALAKFRAKGNPALYRKVLAVHHDRWVKILQKTVKAVEGPYRLLNPVSYLVQDGVLDENAASAIAMGTYQFISENGNDLYTNYTEKQRHSVMAIPEEDFMPQEINVLAATIGMREATLRNEIGDVILQLMDITLPEGTPANELEMLKSALGTHGLLLLQRDGFLERNIYNGLEVRPEGLALANKLKAEGTMPDTTGFHDKPDKKMREALWQHLRTTSLTQQERTDFFNYAFQSHVFVRNVRGHQADVAPLFATLKKEGLYKEGTVYTQSGFNKQVEQSKLLGPIAQGRLIQVYKAWINPKTKNLLPHEALSQIVTASRGSRAFMDELLGSTSKRKLPHTDKDKAGFTQKTRSNSDIGIPAYHVATLDVASKQGRTVQQGMLGTKEGELGILTRLFAVDDTFLPLLGGRLPDGAWVHAEDEITHQVRDELLEREARLIQEHMTEVLDGDSTKLWYKNYAVHSNDRVGEDSQGWNSQASLMQRGLESAPEWEFEVDPTDPGAENTMAFKYAIAQSLGVSIDRMGWKAAVDAFNQKRGREDVQEAIDLLNLMRNDNSYTWDATERARFIELVTSNTKSKPAEGTQYMRGLLELARYQDGKSFKTDISAEVDGRASGATLTMLQFGMGSEHWANHMLLGGIIPVDGDDDNAGEAYQRSKRDIYKTVVADAVIDMQETVAMLKEAAEAKGATWRERANYDNYIKQRTLVRLVMGSLTNLDPDSPVIREITGAARQAVKEGTTANVFGAVRDTLQSTMSNDFYDLFKLKVVEHAKNGDQLAADTLMKAVNDLLFAKQRSDANLIYQKPNADYTEKVLNTLQREKIKDAIKYTFAAATADSIESNFASSRAVSKKVITGLAMAQKLYKAIYDAEKRIVLNAQNQKAIEANNPFFLPSVVSANAQGRQKTQYQPDLTPRQDRQIRKKLDAVFPMIQSASSQLEKGDADKGFSAFKSGTRSVDEVDNLTGSSNSAMKFTGVRGKVQLTEPVVPFTSNGKSPVSVKAPRFQGRQRNYQVEGISGLAGSMHNQDAKVALDTFVKFFAINAHDGFTAGGGQMAAMGQKANQSFLDTITSYSPGEQIAKTVIQSVDAFDALRGQYVGDKQFALDMVAALPLVRDPETREMIPVDESPAEVAYDLLVAVSQAEADKFRALSHAGFIDQYYYPGSAYAVSDAQRADFAKRAESSNIQAALTAQRSPTAEAFPNGQFSGGAARAVWEDLGKATVAGNDTRKIRSYAAETAAQGVSEKRVTHALQAAREKNYFKTRPITASAVRSINAELRKQSSDPAKRRIIPAIESAMQDSDAREYYIAALATPGSGVFAQIPDKHLPDLKAAVKAFQERPNKGNSEGYMYSPSASAEGSPLQYSTNEVFDALDNGDLPDIEAEHLKGLLKNITDTLYDNSGGGLPGLTRSDMGESVDDLAARHTIENIGPFSSNLHRAGIQLSRAQSFVAEQVEITMQEALASQTLADNDMVKLYKLAKSQIATDGSSFYEGDWTQATDIEKEQAKQAYDLIFTGQSNTIDSKSDQLSRFVALGLTYPALRNQLNKLDAPVVPKIVNESLGARLERYFNLIMSKISNLINGVRPGTPVDEALNQLAKKLALNEHKRRITLDRAKLRSVDFIEDQGAKIANAANKAVVRVAASKIISQNKYAMVRAMGDIATDISEDRVDAVMALLERWRDNEKKGVRETLIRAIMSQLRGETPENRVFIDLLSNSKIIEQTRKEKKDITQDEILHRFIDSQDLNKRQKAAITQLYLRSDMAGLLELGYDMKKIHEMVLDTDKRRTRIRVLQDRLLTRPGGKTMVVDTTEMASVMATGRNVSEFGFLNARALVSYADNTAHPLSYGSQDSPEVDTWTEEGLQSVALVDELGSLMALELAPLRMKNEIASIVGRESARGDKDGFRYIVNMHRRVLKNSRENLFDHNAFTTIKGYVRESYNPYNTIEIAGAARGRELLDMGYSLYKNVKESALTASKDRVPVGTSSRAAGTTTGRMVRARDAVPAMYILKDVGLADFQTGAMMNNQFKARGSVDKTAFIFEAYNKQFEYASNRETVDLMVKRRVALKKARIAKLSSLDAKNYRPVSGQDAHEMPVINQQGFASGFRYMATHQTRDEAMERDNRFESVLGTTVSNNYSKQESIEQNKSVLKVLKEFYDASYEGNENRFVEVSAGSSDPRLAETYTMLSDATKAELRRVWGGNRMMIRKDLIDTVLGYRNLTTDVVVNSAKLRIDQMLSKQIVGQLLGPKRAIQVRRIHDHVAEIMRKYKSFIVVRNATTLKNNISSNATLLFMYGVSLQDNLQGHRRAFQGLREFSRDHKKLLRLEADIEGSAPGDDMTTQELEILELQHALDRNPVKPLIDQGMFQTILDDVDLDKENSIYLNASEKFIENQVNKLPDIVAKVGKEAFAAEGTWTYKMLSHGTQMSDFIARFVLYEHLKKASAKAPEGTGMTEKQIITEVREAFVNYNRPMDQRLQYLNDVGLLKFTKYTLGTQKIIFNRLKKAPSRSMIAYMADRHIAGVESILGSNMITTMGNPFDPSILQAPGVLDEPIWIKLGLALGFR